MIAYKLAKSGDKRVIVTLEIPEDALTNMNRSSVAVKETAKHRANKMKVIKIEDEDGKTYESASTAFWQHKSVIYTVGHMVECEDFDMQLEKVCSAGIHFFLTRRCAELYELSCIKNGVFEQWYENGQIFSKCIYKNGLKNGLCQGWYEDGQKWLECTYMNDRLEGIYKSWYFNGLQEKEIVLKNGVKNGPYKEWYTNGQKKYEANYIDDNLDGLCQGWNEYGHLMVKTVYKRGLIVEL